MSKIEDYNELVYRVETLYEWLEHDIHCEYWTCDVCSCGLREAKENVRSAFLQCQTSVNS